MWKRMAVLRSEVDAGEGGGALWEEMTSPEEVEGHEEVGDISDKETPPTTSPVPEPKAAEPVDAPQSVEIPAASAASAPVPPVATPAEVAEPQPPADPKAQREEVLKALLVQYALSGEDAAEIQTSPEIVVPRLLAKMHMQILEQLVPTTLSRVPQIIDQMSRAQAQAASIGQQFIEKWPQLKDSLKEPQAVDAVSKMARAYRSMNPQATAEDVINQVGAMAMVHFKVPLAAAPAAIVPDTPPFQPAGQGAVRGLPTQPAAKTVFEELVEEEMAAGYTPSHMMRRR